MKTSGKTHNHLYDKNTFLHTQKFANSKMLSIFALVKEIQGVPVQNGPALSTAVLHEGQLGKNGFFFVQWQHSFLDRVSALVRSVLSLERLACDRVRKLCLFHGFFLGTLDVSGYPWGKTRAGQGLGLPRPFPAG